MNRPRIPDWQIAAVSLIFATLIVFFTSHNMPLGAGAALALCLIVFCAL